MPGSAKLLMLAIVAYAASPIDLIPDFIPVIGYVDDLIIIPLGIALIVKLVPVNVWRECEAKATEELDASLTAKSVVVVVIGAIWVVVSTVVVLSVYRIWYS